MNQEGAAQPRVVIIPSAGLGHLIPLAELAKKLVLHHAISITLFIPTIGPEPAAQKSVIQSLPELINVLYLPQVDFNEFEPEEVKVFLAVPRSVPFIRNALRALATKEKLVSLVVDMFGTDAFEVAAEFRLSRYLSVLSPSIGLSLLLRLPELDRTVSCEFRDIVDPVQLPGSVSVHGRDFPDIIQDRKSKAYENSLRLADRARRCDGIILNDFYELQPGAFQAMEAGAFGSPTPTVFPVGPLIRNCSEDGLDRTGCLSWLDQQPIASVLYVSFGSGGTLSSEEVHELALGLEMSRTRFLWVVRIPNEETSRGAFFKDNEDADRFDFLPKGFLERTRGVGLVVSNWAPQTQILSHGSTGGFITHCGWNSVLEAIAHGVPLITWPLYAEQKMNAVLLVEGLKVALRANAGENGMVARDKIVKAVKGLMEGEDGIGIRERMQKLKNAATEAVGPDGSSTKSLAELAKKWKDM